MKITELLENIDEYVKKGGTVYGVSIHGVGFGFRIGSNNIEEIIGNQFFINNIKVKKELYDTVYNHVHPIWVSQGKQYQNRGLY
jgi:hypothetical protein